VKTARNALVDEIEKMYPGQQLPGGGFACQKVGCGKATWNGQPNEYCSKVCKTSRFVGTWGPASWAGSSSAPIGVGGGVGGFSAAGTYTCRKPGCNKPTWNGQPGEYCSKGCRTDDQANQFPSYDSPSYAGETHGPSYAGAQRDICMKPGCSKPTWNGQPGEYCSKACRPPQQPQSYGGSYW